MKHMVADIAKEIIERKQKIQSHVLANLRVKEFEIFDLIHEISKQIPNRYSEIFHEIQVMKNQQKLTISDKGICKLT